MQQHQDLFEVLAEGFDGLIESIYEAPEEISERLIMLRTTNSTHLHTIANVSENVDNYLTDPIFNGFSVYGTAVIRAYLLVNGIVNILSGV